MNRRIWHGPSATGPWTQRPDQGTLPITVSGLTNGETRFFKGANVDPVTGLVSAESAVISAIPNPLGGGGNPSPLVSWAEPILGGIGLPDPGALTPAGDWLFNTATLIEDFDFPGGMRIGGAPRHVVIRRNRFRMVDGQGGANLNGMNYCISANASFAGGTVTIQDNDFTGAYSASILANYGTYTISRNVFLDSGGDHIKMDWSTEGTNYITQNLFLRMANTFIARGYNDPTNTAAYQNVSYIHGDACQLENLQPGVSAIVLGNAFDLVGTYASQGAPLPTEPGFPVGPYSAAVFCVARDNDIEGDQFYVPFLVEGNWIKGTGIPVRFDNKNGHLNTGWACKNNIFRPEMEHNLLDYVGAGEVSGNLWEPTGENCDAHMLAGSGPDPAAAA